MSAGEVKQQQGPGRAERDSCWRENLPAGKNLCKFSKRMRTVGWQCFKPGDSSEEPRI